MAGRAGEDHLVLEERLEADGAVAASGADDAELELALGHEVDTDCVSETVSDTRTPGCSRWNSHRRIGTTIAAGPVEAPIESSPVSSPWPSPVTSSTSCSSSDEQPLRAAVEPQTRLRRLDPAAGAVEQLRAEPLLERPHLQRHGRLRDAEPLGRLREALALDDGAERGELARIHKPSLSTACPPRRVLTTS